MHNVALIGLLAGLVSIADCAAADAPGDAQAWRGARPSVAIELEPGIESGEYRALAVVTDLRDGAVLARPQLTVQVGTPAVVELGNEDGIAIRFEVGVDATGTRATWVFKLRDAGVVQSEQRATFTLLRPGEAAY